ncbi:MAG: chromosome segregation protein SMC, partial [Rhodocyclaceae bacterium]
LGPRAYAIIEQGTISRLIEARPEELRLFLEEAAGVTKYKERRRETENRLADARENLTRVEDICTELGHQIGRLESQAEVARHYHALNAELTDSQNLLWLLKRNNARNERERAQSDVEKAITRLEAETASLRELELKTEEARSEHYAASDALHAAQNEMFAANAEVARLESELQHQRDTRQRLDTRLAQLDAGRTQWQSQLEPSERDQQRWQDLLDNARERHARAQARHETAAERLPEAEDALREAESAAALVRRELGQAEQQLRVEEAHRASALRALETLGQRRTRLVQDRDAIQGPDLAALDAAQALNGELDARAAERQAEAAELQARLPDLQAALRQTTDAERAAQKRATELRARRDALAHMQAKVQQNGKLGDWLQRHRLSEAAPLWRSLQVEPGWETAVEAVLRERFSATLVESAESVPALLNDAAPASVAVGVAGVSAAAAARPERGEALAGKVRCTDDRWQGALADWLCGIYVAEDLGALLPRRGVVQQRGDRLG